MTPEVQNGYIPEHEFIRDPADCARVRCFREGCDANDHNHRVYRNQKGAVKGNPYEVNSEEWKAWRDGYGYRDMVNDG